MTTVLFAFLKIREAPTQAECLQEIRTLLNSTENNSSELNADVCSVILEFLGPPFVHHLKQKSVFYYNLLREEQNMMITPYFAGNNFIFDERLFPKYQRYPYLFYMDLLVRHDVEENVKRFVRQYSYLFTHHDETIKKCVWNMIYNKK